jgi:mono/diheme cytochrome c family protein
MGKLFWGGLASPLGLMLCAGLTGGATAQDADLGKRIFTERADPPCAACHTLKAADSSGEIGPNLDELKPGRDRIRQAVKNGVGIMPAFADKLSDAEIEAVSAYVADAVHAGK